MSKKDKKSSKSVAKTAKKPTKKVTGLTAEDYDEVDQFHTKKDQILLEENDDDVIDSDEADYNPDTILDLPDSEDYQEEEVDDDEEYFKNDVESDGEDEDHDWGRGRKNYYSADKGKGEEEAAEAERLYKKKLSSMSAKDFGVSEQAAASSKDAKKPVVKSVTFSSDSEEEQVESSEKAEKSPAVEQVERDLEKALAEVKQVLQPFIDKVAAGSFPRSEGLSFLQTKYNLLLQYCINAVYYVKAKAEGKTIKDDDLVMERLIKYRMLIEKTKPLEAKLKYQIDRLLKAALEPEVGQQDGDDQLRARPELMKSDNEDGVEEDGEEGENADGVYRPPKTMQTEMFDERKAANKNIRQSRIQEELLKEELMDDEAPEEDDIDPVKRVGSGSSKKSVTGTADSLDDVEEDNFVRFQLSKKDKRKLAEQSRIVDGLDDLNDMFDEFDRRRGGKKGKAESEDEADVVIKGKKPKRRNDEDDDEIDSDIASGNEGGHDGDDYYEQVKSAKKAKRQHKDEDHRSKKQVHFRDIADLDADQPRPATKSILSNRGLTPHRNRDIKNPRVKQRMRFEKASKRLGSFRPVHRTNSGPYAGETTGIRSNITRSTKF